MRSVRTSAARTRADSSARVLPVLLLVTALLAASGPGVAIGASAPATVIGDATNAQPRPSGTAPDDASYLLCGRVFSDPHAYWTPTDGVPDAQAPGRSPWAKGNAECQANDFLTYQDMIDGSTYLEQLFPQFIEFHRLEEDFGGGDDCSRSTSNLDMCSAGLPRQGVSPDRLRSDLYMIRVTDERVAVGGDPTAGKRHFVFPLSIHGIERAGVEAGARAAEDLATWAYCEAINNGEAVETPTAPVGCPQEGDIPHPLLETQPATSVKAGSALKQSVIYFVFANPDGWRRGDPVTGIEGTNAEGNVVRFYQRYNGNGVDMNRDWPTIGYTFKPYTPWSEPETRSFGKVLQEIGPKDANGNPKWDGGIDLHGQLIDRAFSFTLLGASERNYSKNQRILQTVKGAWADAEARLKWSPAIKPNDAPEDDPRVYGVQWGTVWDTIDYTVTGSLGDWIDSPLGLNGDGIDNEMSLSHLSNCGTGSCYLKDAEQLHVDGNKSLIYAMVNFSLLPEETRFRAPGKVGYVYNPQVLRNEGELLAPVPGEGLDPQEPIMDVRLDPTNGYTKEFEIKGQKDGVYNGGVEGKATATNVEGVSAESTTSLVLERYRPEEADPNTTTDNTRCATDRDRWQEINRYFNQSSVYLQAGQAVHTNLPIPGRWRICVTGGLVTQSAANGYVDLDITFSQEKAWEDPGQLPYNATNMKFFADLARNMDPGQLVPVSVDDVLTGSVNLDRFTSLVIADDPLPGFTEPIPTGPAQPGFTKNPTTDPGSNGLTAAATVPCAYPTNPVLPPTCHVDYEFDASAESNNQQLSVTLRAPEAAENDWDLYLQRQSRITGEWFNVGSSTTATGNEDVTILTPPVGHYRARIINWAGTQPPNEFKVAFSNEYAGPPRPPSARSLEERNAWGAKLRSFAERGGNLVLTDAALKNVAYMGVLPRNIINNFTVYAGYIGFTRDGEGTTYDDPLARNVNQPGAAEGEGHRHQTYEPVPIGYAIQNESGADFNASPVWAIDQVEWEKKGGRTVGLTTADQVTLGELKVGNGRVRIIGPLLPMPTEQYYHPFGLANYALTYTGYQVLENTLDWTRHPPISINDVTVTEGDSGSRNATFALTMPNASANAVTVKYATADGTARAGKDYTAKSGSVTFAAGETRKTVSIPVLGDTTDEWNERFYVNLSGAILADGRGVGTILDNDPLPSLRINDVSVTERDTTSYADFTVRLDKASGKTVTVRFATQDGSARAPDDYTARSGTLWFSPGQVTKTIRVAIKGENRRELTETFYVNLSSAVNATIADARGVGTIRDDDPDDPFVVLRKTGPTEAAPATVIRYALSYKNLGPFASAHARIVDSLPTGVSFYSATNGGTYDASRRQVKWSLGTVPTDGTGTVYLRVRLWKTLADGTLLVNRAQFYGDQTYSAPASAVTVVQR